MKTIKALIMAGLLFASCKLENYRITEPITLRAYGYRDFVEEGIFDLKDMDGLISFESSYNSSDIDDKRYYEWALDTASYEFEDFIFNGERGEVIMDRGTVVFVYITNGVITGGLFFPDDESACSVYLDGAQYKSNFTYLYSRWDFYDNVRVINDVVMIDWNSRDELSDQKYAEVSNLIEDYIYTSAHLNQWLFNFEGMTVSTESGAIYGKWNTLDEGVDEFVLTREELMKIQNTEEDSE